MERKYAVVVVDMLNDFITGSLMSERAGAIIPNISKVIESARRNSIPVIFVNDAHIHGEDRELEIWGDHAIDGTHGAEVIDQLKPCKGDIVIKKRKYSGFHRTELNEKLAELGVTDLIFTGIHAHICVLLTVNDAYQNDYGIVLADDAITAFTEDDYRMGMGYMKSMFGASTMHTIDIIRMFGE